MTKSLKEEKPSSLKGFLTCYPWTLVPVSQGRKITENLNCAVTFAAICDNLELGKISHKEGDEGKGLPSIRTDIPKIKI